MAGVIFGGFLFVLKWVFIINQKILDDMAEERKAYQLINTGFIANIKELSTYEKEFHKTVREDHKASREEHKEMIEILGRINGYKNQ